MLNNVTVIKFLENKDFLNDSELCDKGGQTFFENFMFVHSPTMQFSV